MRLAMLVLAVSVGSGCATLLTGTRQDVTLTSRPPATYVAFSGVVADVLIKAKSINDAKDFIVNLLSGVLDEPSRAFLLSLNPDELLTVIFLLLQPSAPSLAAFDTVRLLYERIPPVLRDAIARFVPVVGLGVSPQSLSLKKGKEYAVVSWLPLHRAHLLTVETRFNFVTLLNVFTLGLGAIVDVLTGAYLNLSPTELDWALAPLAPQLPMPIPVPFEPLPYVPQPVP